MQASSRPLLSAFFEPPPPDPAADAAAGGGAVAAAPGKKTRARRKVDTVSSRFKTQLHGLTLEIASTGIHYIRCIKPNGTASANDFEQQTVANQLQVRPRTLGGWRLSLCPRSPSLSLCLSLTLSVMPLSVSLAGCAAARPPCARAAPRSR
jgi:hypothetical protein